MNDANNRVNYGTFQDYLKHNVTDTADTADPKMTVVTDVNGIPHRKPIPTQIHTYFFVVDSRDRSNGQERSNFFVQQFEGDACGLDVRYKNVISIMVWEAILPDFTDEYPYLVVQIPQFKDVINGTNNELRNSFGLLTPERVNGKYVTCKNRTFGTSACVKTFNPPLASLGNFQLKIINPDGTLHDFETPNSDFMIMFRVCCEQPCTNKLNYSIV